MTGIRDPRPLDASLRSMAGYNLKRAYLLIREAVLKALAPYGLRPPSFSALVVVCDNPDLTQSRLAEALHIKRSGMVVIIDELEQHRRGPYAGAVGYIDFTGNMDTCIALRTLVIQGDTVYVQAGAGVVADSVPELEYKECMNKARALIHAIDLAREGAD